MDERSAWVALNVFPGIGPIRFRSLYERFGGALGIWNAAEPELRACGLPDQVVIQFLSFRRKFHIGHYLKILDSKQTAFITLNDTEYPKLLKEIPDAPFVLYVKGDTDFLTSLSSIPAIAVVGTRRMTAYGRMITEKLTQELCYYGFTIVSGMAYGIDAVAHTAAIQCGGRTVAVLGCGIDIIAPSGNAGIYHQLTDSGKGVVISEIPLGIRPVKGMFTVRNRLISGLSLGVLVTEGTETSGALITAKYAAQQGREVFAVPGQVNVATSRGPSLLIKQGAKLVENVSDIVDELKVTVFRQDPPVRDIPEEGLDQDSRDIAEILVQGGKSTDELIRQLNIPSERVISALTHLEVHGIVKPCGDTMYELILR